jgi:hypothetical protein
MLLSNEMMRGKIRTIEISSNKNLMDTGIPPFLETLDYRRFIKNLVFCQASPPMRICCRWQAGYSIDQA